MKEVAAVLEDSLPPEACVWSTLAFLSSSFIPNLSY